MRRYRIVSGILLILPIIDFALAAPVLVREKVPSYVDVVHLPEDMVTVLGKRVGGEELEQLAEGYLKSLGNPVDSSGTHAPLGSAPSEPDHGPTNVVQSPSPNPVPSTAGPEHAGSDDHLHVPLSAPAVSQVGLDHGLTQAHTPQLNPNLDPYSGFDLDQWAKELNPPPQKPAMQKPSDPNPSTDNLDWIHWTKALNSPLPKPASSTISNWKNNLKNIVNLKDTPLSGPASQASNEKTSTGLGTNWKNTFKNFVTLKDPPPSGPASSQASSEKPSTGLGINWKNNLKNLVKVKDPPPSAPPSSQASSEKPSTGLGIDWKNNLKNLVKPKDPAPPGPGSWQASSEKQSTGLGIDWKKLVNLKDPGHPAPPPDQASSSSQAAPIPKPSIKAGLTSFADNVIDMLAKLDPLPRPQAPPPSSEVWQSWDPEALNADAASMRSRPRPALKIGVSNTGSSSGPPVIDAVQDPNPNSIENAAYTAKGKAIDTSIPEEDSDDD